MNDRSLLILILLVLVSFVLPFSTWGGNSANYHDLRIYSQVIEPKHIVAQENFTLTWTSRWSSTPQSIAKETEIVGDHVVLNATFAEDMNVARTEITLLDGFRFTTTRPTVEYTSTGWFFDPDDFDWVQINGLKQGWPINISADFTNGDCDFWAWPSDFPMYSRNYGNNLLSMSTVDKPEKDSIIWTSDNDSMDIACLNYDGIPGNWTLDLIAGHMTKIRTYGSTSNLDTYLLENNATVDIRIKGYTAGNNTLVYDLTDVRFSNYFAPHVWVDQPRNLGDYQYNITWTSSDLNADDVNYHSVWLSGDGGVSFQLLTRNLTQSFFVWDSHGYLMRDNYIARVRSYSLDFTSTMCGVDNPPNSYWPGDFSNALSFEFRGGDVHSGGPSITAPSPYTIIVYSQPDITYTFGTTGNQITWTHSYPAAALYYVVTIDGNHYQSGSSSNRVIIVSIDELSIGDYEFEVVVESSASDSVIVHVIPTPEESSLRTGLLTGISAGSAIIIVLSMVLINRIVRRSRREKSLELLVRTNSTPLSILELEREDS